MSLQVKAKRKSIQNLEGVRPVSAVNLSAKGSVFFGLIVVLVGVAVLHFAAGIDGAILQDLVQGRWDLSFWEDFPKWRQGASSWRLRGAKIPRWALGLIGLSIGLVGATILLHGLALVSVDAKRSRARREGRHQEWVYDYPWMGRQAVPRDRSLIGFLFLDVLLPFLLLTMFTVVSLWLALNKTSVAYVFVAFVGLMDLIFVTTTWKKWVQRTTFAGVLVDLDQFPERLGGSLSVRVKGLESFSFERLKIRLVGVQEVYNQVDPERLGRQPKTASITCKTFYSDEKVFDSFKGRGLLSLQFELPSDSSLSSELASRPARFWELQVLGDCHGVNLDKRFLVPIY